MASPRSRLMIALALCASPVVPMACTADQFVGGDGGPDATDDRGAGDGSQAVDGATNDAKGDVVKVDGGADGCASAADASANFSCGSGNLHCLTTVEYCEEVITGGICLGMPAACLCDHSCTCLKASVANFCGDAGITCNNNSGELTLGCQ